jgi:hypothetical protein
MIKGLQGVDINDRKKLPEVEAIYLVWTKSKLLYIGQTINLQKRFTSHHRLVNFLNAEARVSWFDPLGCDRIEIEGSLIDILAPTMNGEIITGGDRRIDIIVTEKEFEILEQYCEDNGQTKTAVIRELIRTLEAHTAFGRLADH